MATEPEELNQAWARAWLDKDADTVDRMMADGYYYISPKGQLISRSEVLDIIRSREYRLVSAARTEVSTKRLGPEAVALVSHWQGEGSYLGSRFHDDHRCTTIFIRKDGEWQLALEHCSPIEDDWA